MEAQYIYAMRAALVNCHVHLLMLAMQKIDEANRFEPVTQQDYVTKHELNCVAKGWLECVAQLSKFTNTIQDERAN